MLSVYRDRHQVSRNSSHQSMCQVCTTEQPIISDNFDEQLPISSSSLPKELVDPSAWHGGPAATMPSWELQCI